MLAKFLKEPLLHFLIIGLGLFVLNGFINGSVSDDPRVITVDRPALLTYMQYRSKAFDPKRVEEALDSMDEKTRGRLIEEYVREEALHREALALELERNDYIIKKRLIQKKRYEDESFICCPSNCAPLATGEARPCKPSYLLMDSIRWRFSAVY